MEKRKIYLETNGCLSRSLDLKRLEHYFLLNNCEIVGSEAKADDIVFLGCAAVKQEEDWSLQRVDRLQKYRGKLVVGGCIKEMADGRFPSTLADRSISTKNIEDVDGFFPDFVHKFTDVPDANEGMRRNLKHYVKNNVLNLREFRPCYFRKLIQYYHTRVRRSFIIRIGRGCDERCTFCTIWRAIGSHRSKPFDKCLEELEIAIRKNVKLINLVSDNMGAYGTDIGRTLPELIRAMAKRAPDTMFTLEEMHPRWFLEYQEELHGLIKAGMIFSLHIPIQSGSDRVLQRMNRKYSMAQVREPLAKIKQINPKVRLYTDLIIGFPSETEGDFDESLDAVRRIGVDSLSYYEYDSKYNSSNMKEFPRAVVRKRVDRLAAFLWENRIGGAPF